jgi:hypothetical protein
VRVLAVLLGIEAAILWRLVHQPPTPLGPLCWALALYSLGWTLYSLWELATTPRKRRATNRRYR